MSTASAHLFSRAIRAAVLLSLGSAPLLSAQAASPAPVTAIPALDLTRYAGRWHEIARLPNWFQKKCVRETVAEYELLADTTMRVVNSCRQADSTLTRAEGRAKLAERGGPASKLKVRFAPRILSFLPMVWGDYWVLDLTDDYTVALVGTPDRKYLWILARVPDPDPALYQRMVDAAAAQGFDVTRLVRAP